MSNIDTTYALFEVQDYKKENVLSSYNLSITPLTFKADIPTGCGIKVALNNTTATFDLGDGTLVNSTTAIHTYELPGKYKVRMILRDCENNNILGSYSTDVNIYNYIDDTFTVDITGDTFPLSAGEFSKTVDITNKSPFFQGNNDIFYSVSGTGLPNYFDFEPYKFNHLKRYHSFYERKYIDTLSAYEFNEISKFSLSSNNIYVRLSGTKIIGSNSTEEGSVLAGVSGKNIYIFNTDSATDRPILINLFKDRKKIFSRNRKGGYSLNDYNNNLYITLTADVGVTNLPANLSSTNATSNGLDSEGFEEATIFGISPVQFKGVRIPFLVKPKSITNFTVKDLSAVGTPDFTLTDEDDAAINVSYYTIESLSSSIKGIDTKFWYYGGLTFNDSLSTQTNTLKLSVSSLYTNGTSTFSLTSNVATISTFPDDYYRLAKQNENVDYTEIFKSLRFQEILLDKNILFDDFIGSIFGDLSSSYDSLGKTLNSKIYNFVDNKINIDSCDVKSLIALGEMLDQPANIFDPTLLQFPVNVARFVSLFSTTISALKGAKNQFSENFNDRGFSAKTVYGKNLGDELTTSTYVITAGTDIVAREKFSNTYSLLNSYQPLSAATLRDGSTTKFSLSEYASTWGWPLVLPSNFTTASLDTFYDFYDYTSGVEGSYTDGIVNFNDPITNAGSFRFDTPLSAFINDNNIEDIIFRNSLFSSLSLFEI